MRRYGNPKTEEERRATHKAIYRTEELPPRGTGLKRPKELIQLTIAHEHEFPRYRAGMTRTPELPRFVELTRENYRELAEKYGRYILDWFFVEPNKIKYFDKETKTWKYAYIPSSKIYRVAKKLEELV